jgi:hypothetical protein
MLRLIISASLFALATFSGAEAKNLGCNPAVQNWVNGSKTACPFDSNTAVPQPILRVEVAPPPPPPPPPIEED